MCKASTAHKIHNIQPQKTIHSRKQKGKQNSPTSNYFKRLRRTQCCSFTLYFQPKHQPKKEGKQAIKLFKTSPSPGQHGTQQGEVQKSRVFLFLNNLVCFHSFPPEDTSLTASSSFNHLLWMSAWEQMILLMQKSLPDSCVLSSLRPLIVLVETWPFEMDTRTAEKEFLKKKKLQKEAENSRNFSLVLLLSQNFQLTLEPISKENHDKHILTLIPQSCQLLRYLTCSICLRLSRHINQNLDFSLWYLNLITF